MKKFLIFLTVFISVSSYSQHMFHQDVFHGGVTVGSEMSSGVKNMHVSNCTFIGTDVDLFSKISY